MEEMVITLKDLGSFRMDVDPATASLMRKDNAFAFEVFVDALKSGKNNVAVDNKNDVNNNGQPLSSLDVANTNGEPSVPEMNAPSDDNNVEDPPSSYAEDSPCRAKSPNAKRLCNISTPEGFKKVSTSTPTLKSYCKSLTPGFQSMGKELQSLKIAEGDKTSIKVLNVPHPFMLRTFTTNLEKFRQKRCPEFSSIDKAVVRCYDYNRASRSVLVELASKDIAQSIVAQKNAHFLNSTVLFESSSSPDESFEDYVHELSYSKDPVNGNDTPLPSCSKDAANEVLKGARHEVLSESEESEADSGTAERKGYLSDPDYEAQKDDSVEIVDDFMRATTTVRFSGFDGHFKKHDFKAFLEKCMSEKRITCKGQDTSFIVGTFRAECKSVDVDFYSYDVAVEMCAKAQFIVYLLHPLTLMIIEDEILPLNAQIKAEAEPSFYMHGQKVIFGNLDPSFKKENFVDFLSLCLKRKVPAFKDREPHFIVGEYNEIMQSVEVEFESAEVAKEVCLKLRKVKYMLQPWVLTMPHSEIVSSSVSMKTRVEFAGIEPPFRKHDFEAFLYLCLKKKVPSFKDCKPQITIESYDEDMKSLVVWFESAETAEEVCAKLKGVEYMLEPWVLTVLHSEVSTNKKVKFEGIDPPFRKTFLCKCLEKKISSYKNRKPEFTVEIYDESTKSVVVGFESAEVAKEICTELQGMQFMLEPWILTIVESCNKGSTSPNFLAEGGRIVSGLISTNERPEEIIMSLGEGPAIIAFLEECIEVKGTKPEFKGTEDAMRRVSDALRIRHNIHVSVAECQRRKKRLYEQHRRNPASTYSKYIAYLRGETATRPKKAVPGISSSTTSFDMQLAKFTKGASMDHGATLSLIDIWHDEKEEYRSVHKNTAFYKNISNLMVLRGHHFSPEQCQYKMDMLLKEFKLYVSRLRSTGQGRPAPWEYYELLRPILEDMVSVDPEGTLCVGAMYATTRNPHVQAVPPSGGSRTGANRQRPPASSTLDDKRAMVDMLVQSRLALMEELKGVATQLERRKSPD